MRRFRYYLALFLFFAFSLHIFAPHAHAVEPYIKSKLQLSETSTIGDYSIRGAENNYVRLNILINEKDNYGQFAIILLDSPDYVYEFSFNLENVSSCSSSDIWDSITEYCFSNTDQWIKIHIPSAVTTINTKQIAISQPQAKSSSYPITYFEDWLEDRYGSDYGGLLISTNTINGVNLYLKAGYQSRAYLDGQYLVNETISIVSFVTSIFGAAVNQTVYDAIQVILDGSQFLKPNDEILLYTVRANWFHYATLTNQPGYPYGLADKYIIYDGFYNTKTGKCTVAAGTGYTIYDPSYAMFTSHENIFNAAFCITLSFTSLRSADCSFTYS